MTPEQIDRVFGRGRLKMVTGEHVEVFREAVAPGERRRYTKRFLNSTEGDFAHWTEREWRILARLIGHGVSCVPDVVQFDRGSVAGMQLVQTYDAGATVDQWATLLPLLRDGHLYRHAFEDCAHWWALAHHCLTALKEIHQLQLVHLDIKGDNVCIPLGPASFDPDAPGMPLYPMFGQLALIDFAFSLVSRESLTVALPIGWQKEYDYQSPRLLKALEDGHEGDLTRTRDLDWRCDIYSLAAMLKRYLPDETMHHPPERLTGWTSERYDAAKALILVLRDHHDRDAPQLIPHQVLIDATGARLQEPDLARSLSSGWTLARDVSVAPVGASPLTPMTRLAVPLRVFVSPRDRASKATAAAVDAPREAPVTLVITKRSDAVRPQARRGRAAYAALAGAVIFALGVVLAHENFPEAPRALMDGARSWLEKALAQVDSVPSSADTRKTQGEHAAPDTTTAQGPATPSGTPTAPAEEAPKATTASAEAPPGAAVASADVPPIHPTASGGAPPAAATAPDAAPSPPTVQTGPKVAPTPSKWAGAPSKKTTAKSGSPSAARSPARAIAAKPPPPIRVATQAPRTLAPTTGAPSSVKPSRSPEQATGIEHAPAPTHLAQAAPPSSQATTEGRPSSPAPLSPAEAIPPKNPAVNPEPQPASTQEPRASAVPVPPPAARQERTPPASDYARAEAGMLSKLFGLAKRKPAPIEDRSLQAAATADKTSRPLQAPSPPPDRLALATPKAEVPPSTLSTISVARADVQASAPSGPPVVSSPTLPATRDERPSSPTVVTAPEYLSWNRTRENDFAMQARRTLAQAVPRMAVQAQNEIAHVLWAAAIASDRRQERTVVDTAQAVWVRENASEFAQEIEPAAARRLNDEALQAYWIRRNMAEAFDLQLKAFGANPNDPEIAGNLAFLFLKVNPLQPETARQLALHAIAIRGSRFRTGRLEDWHTYAVASALTGRNADARNALFVTLALAGNVERNCRDAASAIASYGERVREPVEAMLYRIYTQGRTYDSPYCTWPPIWAVGARLH